MLGTVARTCTLTATGVVGGVFGALAAGWRGRAWTHKRRTAVAPLFGEVAGTHPPPAACAEARATSEDDGSDDASSSRFLGAAVTAGACTALRGPGCTTFLLAATPGYGADCLHSATGAATNESRKFLRSVSNEFWAVSMTIGRREALAGTPCARPSACTLSVHLRARDRQLHRSQRPLRAGGLAAAAVAAAVAFDVDVEDAVFGNGLSTGLFSMGLPDAAAAAMWSLSLWFVSPLQLLLLFLGKIETERPSDWVMNGLGTLSGQPVKDLGYEHPLAVRAAAATATVAAGCGVAYGLDAGLGDATWGVSSGIASCMAAGVYELGRPTRLSSSEAVQLEEQWQVFGAPKSTCSVQA